jgi:transitional endoplasmic reticulum ATPase
LVAYKAAVRANPTLEDPDLSQRLQPSSNNGGPLRLLRGGGGADGSGPPAEVLFGPPASPITFADVGGLDDLKQRIRRRIILPLQKPSLFDRFRKKAGGGVLLYGPPGCGKTLLARATAGEVDARFLNVQISDVLDMWLGGSEHKLHDLFETARRDAPSVLFFDEVEALGGKRQFSQGQAHANVVSQFLSEMDGFTSRNEGVLIMGATNVPWAIDSAFRRPGRFDRVVFVPPPDRVAREAVLRIHLRDRPLAADIDVALLARRTSGYSGADLEHLVETAVDLAIEESLTREIEAPVRQQHLLDALTEVRSTTTEWLTTARNYARYANESGQYDEVVEFLDKHGKK